MWSQAQFVLALFYIDPEAVFTVYDDMDSVLSDRLDWECPGESADSGSGSDFTRSRWANDILDAEDKFQQAMITVLTGSAFSAPIVAAFDAAFDSESYCQQLPQSAALRVLLTRDLIPGDDKQCYVRSGAQVCRCDCRPASSEWCKANRIGILWRVDKFVPWTVHQDLHDQKHGETFHSLSIGGARVLQSDNF